MKLNATVEPPDAGLQLPGGLREVSAVRGAKSNVRAGAFGNRAPDFDIGQNNPADGNGVVGEQVKAGEFLLKGSELRPGPGTLAQSFPQRLERAYQQYLHAHTGASIR